MQAKLRLEYQALLDGVFAARPGQFPGADAPGAAGGQGAVSIAHFQWAFTMLFSRAIRLDKLTGGPAVALVPYADLINHSPFSTAYINAKPGEKSFFGDEPDKVEVPRGLQDFFVTCTD